MFGKSLLRGTHFFKANRSVTKQFSKLAYPPVFVRSFATKKLEFAPRTNYSIILGGGGRWGTEPQDYIEHSKFLNTKFTYEMLASSPYFNKENIKILYGMGPKDPIYAINDTDPSIKYVPDFPIANVSSREGFKNELASLLLKLTTTSNLFIFIFGHGGKYKGTEMFDGKERMFSPLVLEKELEKIDPSTHVFVYVDSCYSGNYLNMKPRKNVVVFTNTSFDRPSLYHRGSAADSLAEFLYYFNAPYESNLILFHSEGQYYDQNFYSNNTLRQFVEKQLKKYCYPLDESKNSELTDSYHHWMLHAHETKKKHDLYEWAKISTAIVNPMLTLLLCWYEVASKKWHDLRENYELALANGLKGDHFYDESTVKQIFNSDQNMINWCKSYINNLETTNCFSQASRDFLKEINDDLLSVLSQLLDIRKVNASPADQSLLVKSILFLKISLIAGQYEEIRDFLKIAKQTLDPLDKPELVSPYNMRVIEKILTKDTFFKSARPLQVAPKIEEVEPLPSLNLLD